MTDLREAYEQALLHQRPERILLLRCRELLRRLEWTGAESCPVCGQLLEHTGRCALRELKADLEAALV